MSYSQMKKNGISTVQMDMHITGMICDLALNILLNDKKVIIQIFFHFLGGEGLLFWGGFGYNGVLPLIKLVGKINSTKYINMLNLALNGDCHEVVQSLNNKFMFQQDNASVHCSNETIKWLENREDLILMTWPSKSPDLNPIENIWGLMTKNIYAHGKQYNTLKELEDAIIKEWYSLDKNYLKTLIKGFI